MTGSSKQGRSEKRRLSKTKRAKEVLAWGGGIAAAVGSLIVIYDRVVAPNAAKLNVLFAESQSDVLRLVPSIHTAWEFTEDLPCELRIDNVGGKATGNTKLYLAFDDTVQVTTDFPHDQKTLLEKSNRVLRQLAFKIENINPGESYLIPLKIKLRIGREFQEMMARPSSEALTKAQSKTMAFEIYVDLSSDAFSNVRKHMRIIVGRCSILKAGGADAFWVGHGDKGVILLKVEDDYPCE